MVIHNPQQQRFEMALEGKLARLDYQIKENRIALTHTEVPPEFRWHGVGAELAKAALDYAREFGLLVIPSCPYVADYLNKHPEYQEIVDPDYRDEP
jgi:predicted GNAT family acetyltransferase